MDTKKYSILILIVLSILSCKIDNIHLSKIVLASNMEKTVKSSSLDSIVYLYNTIQSNKIYVSQSIHIDNTEQTFYYYLYDKEGLVFLGIETDGDSIVYYPYCSLISHDTIRYDISYLDDLNGFTVLVKDVNSSSKEYTGNLISLNFRDPSTWILNKEFRIERIQVGNFILDKSKEESILKYPNDYRKPISKSIDIFMPPSNKYFLNSKY